MQIIDVNKDPYGRRAYASINRKKFELLKRTVEFKKWRSRQLQLQRHRCAYCKVDLRKNNIIIHVDHVQPLYYDGKNAYSNLVLSCRRCNLKKWVNNRIVVPNWIKENEIRDVERQRLKSLRSKQRAQMSEIVNAELDCQLISNNPHLFGRAKD